MACIKSRLATWHLGGGGRHLGPQAPQILHQAALRHLDDMLAHVHALHALRICPKAHRGVPLVVRSQMRAHGVLQRVLGARCVTWPVAIVGACQAGGKRQRLLRIDPGSQVIPRAYLAHSSRQIFQIVGCTRWGACGSGGGMRVGALCAWGVQS